MNQNPEISVIMPVYNAEKFIDEAIESVISQTYTNFELILINDGSTDNSLAHLLKFAEKDSRCIVHSWENQGIVACLNYGIDRAKSDFIFRMDSDDICFPQRFEKQLKYLNSHPECVAVGTEVLCIDPEGDPISNMWNLHTHEEIDSSNITGAIGSSMCHPSVAMRKSSLLSIGCYRPEFNYAEDYDLFLRLAEVGKLANLPEVLLKYRQHLSSIGHAKRREQLIITKKALDDTFRRRSLKNYTSINFDFDAKYVQPSKHETQKKWAWWALAAGNLKTARKYMYKSLFSAPLSIESWRLLYAVTRGY